MLFFKSRFVLSSGSVHHAAGTFNAKIYGWTEEEQYEVYILQHVNCSLSLTQDFSLCQDFGLKMKLYYLHIYMEDS